MIARWPAAVCVLGAAAVALTVSQAEVLRRSQTFTIVLPEYIRGSSDDVRGAIVGANHDLRLICQGALDIVTNRDLANERRIEALSLLDDFDGALLSSRLARVIDLEEQRSFFSGETFRGKFPIVSLLKGKGSSSAAGLIEALSEEQEERRFAMICDVLRTIYGVEEAQKALERASRQVGATAEKKAVWERASSLLKSSPLGVF